MTVDSHNTEAVSSRTKPNDNGSRSFNEAVLSCPKCGQGMEPMLLGMNEDGTQKAWWTCSAVKTKKCSFPLDMPDNIFWITRSQQDIEKDEVPPPNLAELPIRYQHLYPTIFRHHNRKGSFNGSRQGSHESTNSVSSFDSTGSTTCSVWEGDEEARKKKTAERLEKMRRPRLVLTSKREYVPSMNHTSSRTFAESFRGREDEGTASTSIATAIKFGRGMKTTMTKAEHVVKAKEAICKLMNKVTAHNFHGNTSSRQWNDIKKIVVQHVKKRRAERAKMAEVKKLCEKKAEIVSIDDLVERKLQKNKMEYETRRQAQARAARAQAMRRARMQPSMPGYGDDEDEEEEGERPGCSQPSQQQQHAAAYAATPPHISGGMGSPLHDASHVSHYSDEFDFGMEDYSSPSSAYPSSSTGMDHSGEVPSYGEETDAGSPFADLGPLMDGDLDGLEVNPEFEQAFGDFAQVFGDDFADDFADLSQYN